MVRKLSKQFLIATWFVTFHYNFKYILTVLWQFLKNSGNVCFPDKNYIFIWITTSIYYTVFAVSESCSIVSDSLQPHGLYSPWNLQARILEWVAFPFSRGSSQPKDQTQVSFITGRFFTSGATREAQQYWSG